MIKAVIGAAAASMVLVPLNTAQAASCVWVRNINDFKAANDEMSMVIRDSPSRKYTLTFMGRCMGARYAEAIAVKSVGGMFCLTPGDSISFGWSGSQQRCMISRIEPVAPPPQDGNAGEGQSQDEPEGY